jgi:hypothetical protein
MVQIEIMGNEAAITAARSAIAPLAKSSIRGFQHEGAGGEAGIYGLVTSVLSPAVPILLGLLKRLVASDRDLKISFNGFELNVRDINEAKDVIDLLTARGIIPKGGD